MRPVPLPAGSEPISSDVLEEAFGRALRAATLDDPAAAIDGMIDALYEAIDGGFVSLFLLDHDRLWLAGDRGNAMIPDGFRLDEGIIGRAAHTGAVQFVPDVSADSAFIPSTKGIVSELAIPVSGSDGLVGILNVETTRRLPEVAAGLGERLGHALVHAVERMSLARTLDLSALARLFVYIGSLREPRAIADVAARSLARVIPLEACQLVLRDEEHGPVDLAVWRATAEAPEPLSASAVAAFRARVDAAAVFELLDVRAMGLPELAGSPVRSVALIPLRASGHEIGVLLGTSRFPRVYDHGQAEAASLLGAHVAASIDAAFALSRERRSALTDPLTSLLNRRGFDEALERTLTEAQEARSPFSVLVLDCDDLKEVNDRAGHEFGDALLRELGLVLDLSTGSQGRAARLGGDEFGVILDRVDHDAAQGAADRLLVELRAGLADRGFPVHVSGGLATYPYDGGGSAQLKRAADQALYAAKGAGKSLIVTFRDVSQGAARVEVTSHDRRVTPRPDGSTVTDVLEAAQAMWALGSAQQVLERLAKALPFVLGAAGCVVSKVDGPRLQAVAKHSFRDVWLGEEVAYLLAEFPLTQEVLRSGQSRAVSFLDEDLDRAEAFVLRELGMSCCLLVPVLVRGRAWGLVEVYDQRYRRFSAAEQTVAEFLTANAARRIEKLRGGGGRRRRLPLLRLPTAALSA